MKYFKIKQEPISVNQAYQGRKVKTEEYRSFIESAAWEIKNQKPEQFKGKLFVEVILYLTNEKKSDIDNRLKSIFDACTQGGLWKDDSQIYEMFVSKRKDSKNWVEIFVKNI